MVRTWDWAWLTPLNDDPLVAGKPYRTSPRLIAWSVCLESDALAAKTDDYDAHWQQGEKKQPRLLHELWLWLSPVVLKYVVIALADDPLLLNRALLGPL